MKPRGWLLSGLLALCCALLAAPAWSADRIRFVVGGGDQGNNAQIVRDIAKHVARPADIEFEMRYSVGSPDTLLRLNEGNGLQFSLLQADAAEAYRGAALRGNVEADQLFAPVRAIAPLHDEEIHFIVRGDSPLKFVHDIAGARINLGPLHSGSALTATTLYRLVFGLAIPEQQASFHAYQDALIKLTEGTVDVVVIVAPQPARLLADMKPEARRFVKLLKFDSTHPSAAAALKVYAATVIPVATYANLLDADLPALAVTIYLASHGRNDALQARFAAAWCQNLQRLRSDGHAALQTVRLEPPRLVPGWRYASPFERTLRACIDGKPAPAQHCSQEDRALGLCG